nr:MAG TPA: hypothetical protein [Caudoviricetes sp.]
MYHNRPWYRNPDVFDNIALVCTITLIIGAYMIFVFGVAFSEYATPLGKIIAIGGMTLVMLMWAGFVFADYLKGVRK